MVHHFTKLACISVAILSCGLESSVTLSFILPASIINPIATSTLSDTQLFYLEHEAQITVLRDRKKSKHHTISQINDSNYHQILSQNKAVLVDAYVSNCGPCKLIERSILNILSKYSGKVKFAKWNADTAMNKKNDNQFMNFLREHNMAFRKMPTLILFVNGKPIALRSGMGTSAQLENFMMDHLPWLEMEDEQSNESDDPYGVKPSQSTFPWNFCYQYTIFGKSENSSYIWLLKNCNLSIHPMCSKLIIIYLIPKWKLLRVQINTTYSLLRWFFFADENKGEALLVMKLNLFYVWTRYRKKLAENCVLHASASMNVMQRCFC